MRSRPLGTTGLRVSALALGTMNLRGPSGRFRSARIVHRALERGIDLFDTAPTYNAGKSEVLLGRALRKARRDDVLVATKVYLPDGAVAAGEVRERIVAACEASLRRLRRDRIDLYQLHRPVPSVPVEAILEALDELVHAGKVRFVGCSTHAATAVEEALDASARGGWAAYACEQPPYNVLDRRIERELVPLCRRRGLGLLAWSPLAGGLLAGRYDGGAAPRGSRAARVPRYRQRVTPEAVRVATRVAERARELGTTPAQLALAWVVHQPAVTAAVIGPRTVAHLDAALDALEREPTDADRALVDELVPSGTAVVAFD